MLSISRGRRRHIRPLAEKSPALRTYRQPSIEVAVFVVTDDLVRRPVVEHRKLRDFLHDLHDALKSPLPIVLQPPALEAFLQSEDDGVSDRFAGLLGKLARQFAGLGVVDMT